MTGGSRIGRYVVFAVLVVAVDITAQYAVGVSLVSQPLMQLFKRGLGGR